MNLISVVIPLFNKEVSISRAIYSVINQNYSDFELIIVNDGSTDDSLKEVRKIFDNRIKIYDIKNSGVSYARNFGISQSNSNFVCLLDADDEWHPDFLNEIISLIKDDENASLYACRYEVVNENKNKTLGKITLQKKHFGKVENFFDVYSKSRSFICSSCVCINKEKFKKMGGFPVGKKTGEDIYVWLTLNIAGYTYFSNKVLSTVYRDAENRTRTRVKREIPYHLQYYLFDNNFASKDLKNFCLKNSLLYALEARNAKDDIVFNQYKDMYKHKSLSIYFLILFFSFLPVSALRVLKKLRNYMTFK